MTVRFDRGHPSARSTWSSSPRASRSRTRALAFPDARTTDLGLYLAYLTIPRTPADDDRWRWYNATRGRQVSLRPDNVGTIRAFLGFLSDVRGLEELGSRDQAQILRQTFRGRRLGDRARAEPASTSPFYFDAVGQARLPPVEQRPGGAPRGRRLVRVAVERHGYQPRTRRRLRPRRRAHHP